MSTASSTSGRSLGDDLRNGRDEARDFGRDAGDLANELRELVQKEGQLARAEVQESISHAIRSAIWAGAALLLANALLLFAFTTVMFAIDEALPLWAAALITTGIILLLTAIAGAMAYARMKQISFTPRRTMQSVKEDVKWAKTQMQSTVKS
jgi:uncharacterized membrane protein YqjE